MAATRLARSKLRLRQNFDGGAIALYYVPVDLCLCARYLLCVGLDDRDIVVFTRQPIAEPQTDIARADD